MTPNEREIVLHTFKGVNQALDRFDIETAKGLIDSCVREIDFYSDMEMMKDE